MDAARWSFAASRLALRRHRRELHGLDPIGAPAGPFGPADRLLTFRALHSSRSASAFRLPGTELEHPGGAPPLVTSSVCALPPTSPPPSADPAHRWTFGTSPPGFGSRSALVVSHHLDGFLRRTAPGMLQPVPDLGFAGLHQGRSSPAEAGSDRVPDSLRRAHPSKASFLADSRTASLRPLPSCRSVTP
jgi:hypothetical protein